jgi:hypothetical protein
MQSSYKFSNLFDISYLFWRGCACYQYCSEGPPRGYTNSQGVYDVIIAKREKRCFTIYFSLLHINYTDATRIYILG